jgi:hypothetical protein
VAGLLRPCAPNPAAPRLGFEPSSPPALEYLREYQPSTTRNLNSRALQCFQMPANRPWERCPGPPGSGSWVGMGSLTTRG